MRLLGVSAGAADGSAEILLKAALMAGEEVGHDVALVRVDDLRVPTGAFTDPGPDDGPWFWEQVMQSDGVIYATPIYSRTTPGKLRLLSDRVFGPNADVAFAEGLLAAQRAGATPTLPFPVDERVFHPRVGGFLAVGGALTANWRSLALPLMQSLTFSMQVAVADQVCFGGAGTPASIVLDGAALERARLLGGNVAEQLGRAFDEVEFRGEPGLCPMCHLDVIVVRGMEVECASCGASGRLAVEGDHVSVAFAADGRRRSLVAMDEKRAHFTEVMETAARLGARRDEIAAGAAPYAAWDRRITP